jgi:DNA (cytosine-5)-methyltransferase 1
MKSFYSLAEVADLLSVSKETLRRWDRSGKLCSLRLPNDYRVYEQKELEKIGVLNSLFVPKEERKSLEPLKRYKSIELFAGGGGLALGMEKAGFECVALSEIDRWACETLRQNRPSWNVLEGDVTEFDFSKFREEVDLVTGGFPCQAFSYAGKKLGFKDARGTLFYEFARVVKEVEPLICVAENVRGLLNHDDGKTLDGMVSVLDELGYDVLAPQFLKAIHYNVPQKRERLFIVGVKRNSEIKFEYPKPYQKVLNLRDALKKGILYDQDVPDSQGQEYSERKKEIMNMVPPGGYWRDLPEKVQKEYMLKSYYLGGGKTGMARRISWDEPCLTLTTSPAQKQTERCHPDETRPFTVREYARIQTFPDSWSFSGSVNQQYKQIGNAVPVNLAYEVGLSVIEALNKFYLTKELRDRMKKSKVG